MAVLIKKTLQWILLCLLIGLCTGVASAFFLISLDRITSFRENHSAIIALLPFCGLFLGWLYHHHGKRTEEGTHLIIEEIHEPKNTLPLRMAPMILLSTVATHLFGGSAGREGTAVQMGASLADQLSKPFRLQGWNRKHLLQAGMSAGFASIFGTPWAGMVFGLEALGKKHTRIHSLASTAMICGLSAFSGDAVVRMLGIRHEIYKITALPALTLVSLFSAVLAGLAFGWVGQGFIVLTHRIFREFQERISNPIWRPALGGFILALLMAALGGSKYAGLSLPLIHDAFEGKSHLLDFAGKLFYTALTLGSGFKGGEVTPLFVVGATLGSALSSLLALPGSLLAGMGFVSVFAGAAKIPITCTLMAIEVFGPAPTLYMAIACGVSATCGRRNLFKSN